MKVDSQSVYCVYQNSGSCRFNENKVNSMAFKSMLYNRNSYVYKKLPVLRFMDKYFQRSVTASRMTWHITDKELQPYLKVVDIEDKAHPHVRMWDINDGKKSKYVIVMHGLSQNITSLQELYKRIFDDTEYAVLAPEYHGLLPEDNEDIYFSPKTILRDMENSIRYLNEQGIDNENISVIGHSFSGYSAAKLAKEYPNLESLILVTPVNTQAYLTQKVKESRFNNIPSAVRNAVEHSFLFSIPLKLLFNCDSILRKVKLPVDIIYANADNYTNIDILLKTARICKNLRSLNTVESSHTMSSDKIEKIISILKLNPPYEEQLF